MRPCRLAVLVLFGAFILAALCGPVAAAQFPLPSQSQTLESLDRQSGMPWQVRWHDQTGVPTFLSGRSQPFTGPWEEAARAFLNQHRGLFRMQDAMSELSLLREEGDDLGMKHLRFQQRHQGVRVYHGDLLVHFSEDGEVTGVNGRYWPDIAVGTTPSLTAQKAISLATADLGSPRALPEPPEAELVVVPVDGSLAYRLAWRVEVYWPLIPARWEYLLDAHSGAILQAYDLVCDADTTGSGLGVLGDTKSPLYIYRSWFSYYLSDRPQRYATYSGPTWLPSRPVSDSDRYFTDAAAVDAHYYQRVVHDYYWTRFGVPREAHQLKSYVHRTIGGSPNNAAWDGRHLLYGDGDGTTFLPFSGALDVVAHETTHAVDQCCVGLTYFGQSGALNESFSDVLATMCEFAYPPPAPATPPDWLAGEDVYTPGTPGDAIRSLADPPSIPVLLGGSWVTPPDHMDNYVSTSADNGGVHVNSGIPNKAAYLLSEGGIHPHSNITVTGIGRDKTEQIWFRTLRYYLYPDAQFVDAADGSVSAAIDLYGDGTEAASVRDCWRAVGVSH